MANKESKVRFSLVDGVTAGLKSIVRGVGDIGKSLLKVTGIAGALSAVLAALSFGKIKAAVSDVVEIGEAFEDLEKKFASAFGGLDQGKAALAGIKELAADVPFTFEQIADAAIRLKRGGFDPLDGSLQALVDQTAAADGSAQDLVRTIDTLAKANVKGTLGLREIVALTKQGVPAFDLLAQSTGKTVTEIEALAKSGGIGRREIQGLIAEIGKINVGAAKAETSDFAAQILKLKDQFRDFANEIAKSGTLDFLRDKLGELTDTIQRMEKDGSLHAFAKSISDSIIGTANAIGTGVNAVRTYSDELLTLARGIAAFKVASFVANIASASAGLLQAASAATAAGSASAGAAGLVGGLGAALARLPTSIKIAIAVAEIDLVLTQTERLIDAVGDYKDANREVAAAEESHAATRVKLAASIDQTREAMAKYAALTIKTKDDVAKLSAEEARSYAERLSNATRYYLAVALAAKQTGDTGAQEAARAKLAELKAALAAVQAQYESARLKQEQFGQNVQFTVVQLEDLIAKSGDAKKAIGGIFDGVNFNDAKALQNIAIAFAFVGEKSAEAADQVRDGLAAEIKKLNGDELVAFQAAAEAAFEKGGAAAKGMAVVVDTVATEALLRLGFTAAEAGVQFTDIGQKAIDAFKIVANSANLTSAQIVSAFAKALNTAQTKAEVKALQDTLRQALAAGRVDAASFALAISQASLKLAKLGTDGQAAFGKIDAAASEAQQKIITSLEVTRSQAAATAQKIATDLAKALAAKPGDRDQNLINGLQKDFAEADAAIAALNAEIERLRGVLHDTGQQGGDAGQQTADGFQAAADAAEQTAGASGEVTQATGGIINVVKELIETYRNLSDGAGKFFERNLRENAKLASSVTDYGDAVEKADAATQKAINNQLDLASKTAAGFDSLGATGQAALSGIASKAFFTAEQLEGFAQSIRKGTSQFDLLGQQDLDRLAASVDRAAEKTRSLADAAADAREQLADLNDQLQDEIDRAAGDDKAIEDRRHRRQLEQIDEIAKKTGSINSQQAQEAKSRAERLHRENLQRIQIEADARRKAEGGGGAGGGSAGGNSGKVPPSSDGGIVVNNTFHGVIATDLEELARKTAPGIKKELAKLASFER